MKRRVNGVEVDLAPAVPGVQVRAVADRLFVRTPDGTSTAVAVRRGGTVWVSYQGRVFEIAEAGVRRPGVGAAVSGEMRAPMPGAIVDVLVEVGQAVLKGERLVVLEAMKTHQPFSAPFDGLVAELPVAEGQQVVEGALLVRVVPE